MVPYTLLNQSNRPKENTLHLAQALTGYVNFLRWSANFQPHQIMDHFISPNVVLLSEQQSGHFCFSITTDETMLFGFQAFEEKWLSLLPFSAAYLTDHFYLATAPTQIMDISLPPLAIGFHITSAEKKLAIKHCHNVQFCLVSINKGEASIIKKYQNKIIPLHNSCISSHFKSSTTHDQHHFL